MTTSGSSHQLQCVASWLPGHYQIYLNFLIPFLSKELRVFESSQMVFFSFPLCDQILILLPVSGELGRTISTLKKFFFS